MLQYRYFTLLVWPGEDLLQWLVTTNSTTMYIGMDTSIEQDKLAIIHETFCVTEIVSLNIIHLSIVPVGLRKLF